MIHLIEKLSFENGLVRQKPSSSGIRWFLHHHPLISNIVLFYSRDRWQQKVVPRSFWHCQIKNAANTSHPLGACPQLLCILLRNLKFPRPGVSPSQTGQWRLADPQSGARVSDIWVLDFSNIVCSLPNPCVLPFWANRHSPLYTLHQQTFKLFMHSNLACNRHCHTAFKVRSIGSPIMPWMRLALTLPWTLPRPTSSYLICQYMSSWKVWWKAKSFVGCAESAMWTLTWWFVVNLMLLQPIQYEWQVSFSDGPSAIYSLSIILQCVVYPCQRHNFLQFMSKLLWLLLFTCLRFRLKFYNQCFATTSVSSPMSRTRYLISNNKMSISIL